MTTKSIIQKHQAKGIGEAIEQWRLDHKAAMFVKDLEDILLPLCCELVNEVAQTQETAFKELFTDEKCPIDQFGALHQEMYDVALPALQRVRQTIDAAKREGYRLDGEEKFTAAHEKFKRLAHDFRSRWPFISPLEVEMGRAQIAAGQCMKAEDFFRELASHPLGVRDAANPGVDSAIPATCTDHPAEAHG